MLRILEPLDGTMMMFASEERPMVRVRVASDAAEPVRVLGVPAQPEEDGLWAEVPLDGFKNRITAFSGEESCAITLYRVQAPDKVFRVSLDDNVWCLQDIARKGYASLFENPYLALYRRLNRDYGVKVHMNIYHECPEYGGFSLRDMPDRYKKEWLDNFDWLRLSFHAKANLPNWPYLKAGYEQVREDCARVMDEIERFAGYRHLVTTLHFAEATQEGVRALYDCGVRALLGDFTEDEEGAHTLCYGATREQFVNVRKHCFWRDPKTKMVFFPCDIVLNSGAAESIQPELDRMAARWPDRRFVDLLIHEQYFYPGYVDYLPDYEARLRLGIKWCLARGYAPGFVDGLIDFAQLEQEA